MQLLLRTELLWKENQAKKSNFVWEEEEEEEALKLNSDMDAPVLLITNHSCYLLCKLYSVLAALRSNTLAIKVQPSTSSRRTRFKMACLDALTELAKSTVLRIGFVLRGRMRIIN